MNIPYIIIFLGGIVLLSHIFTYFFNKTHIPNVLFLLLIGILVGPVSGWMDTSFFGQVGPVFSNVVLLFILFESGSGLKLKELRESVIGSFFLTILIFSGTLLITGGMCHYVLKFNWIPSAMVGAILGGTSSAIVIPMIKPIRVKEKTRSLLLMESALSDVLCLITGLALFLAMKSGIFEINEILTDIGINFLVSLFIGFISGFIWSFFIGQIRRLQNSIFITGSYVLIIYGITEYFGFNGGIAVLILGIILGNVKKVPSFFSRLFQHEPEPINDLEKKFFSEIVFVFATYFFVYIGISIQFSSYLIYIFAFVIVILLFALRYFVVRLVVQSEELKDDRRIIFSVAPKGLIPAILASLPLQEGLKDGARIQDVVFAIVFISIVISSFLVFTQQRKAPLLISGKEA